MKSKIGWLIAGLVILLLGIYWIKSQKSQAKIQEELKYKTHLEDSITKKVFAVRKDSIVHSYKAKYNVRYTWNDITYPKSICFDTVILSNFQLIKKAHILDIYRKDTSYYTSLMIGEGDDDKNKYYFDLRLSSTQAHELLKYSVITLIVHIDQIRKMRTPIQINADDEDNGDGSESAVISFGDDDIEWDEIHGRKFFCKGELIEIINQKP